MPAAQARTRRCPAVHGLRLFLVPLLPPSTPACRFPALRCPWCPFAFFVPHPHFLCRCGAEAYEDDAFKLLCGVEGCAGMLLGGGAGGGCGDGSAAVTRQWRDDHLHRMLLACLRGRTGDVHAAAAREVLYENLAHARVPRADDATALGFLRSVTDASALAAVAAGLAAAAGAAAAAAAGPVPAAAAVA